MSLVSLQSQTTQFPFDFNNDFKQGITLRKGSKVELVHSVIHKKKGITINVINNTFKFILGTPSKYITKIIVIPDGTYTPDVFADLVTLQMNAAQVLGIYKGAFKCDYSNTADKEIFSITWAEIPQPELSSGIWNEYTPTKIGGATVVNRAYAGALTNIVLTAASADNDNLAMAVTGSQGLFSNGGIQTVTIQPNAAGDGYNQVIVGHMRRRLVVPEDYGIQGRPLSNLAFACPAPNAAKPYLDMALKIVNNGAALDSIVTFSRIKQQQGTIIGAANWINSVPNTQLLQNTSSLETLLGGLFDYGEDHVKIVYEITGNFDVTVSLAHDNAGDGVFNALVAIITTVSNRSFGTTITEAHYPLVPVVMASGGGNGDKTRLFINGHFDRDAHTGSEVVYENHNIFHDDDGEVNFATNPKTLNGVNQSGIRNLSLWNSELDKNNYTVRKTLGADMQLRSLFLFGTIDLATDFVSVGGTIPDAFNAAAAGNNRITDLNSTSTNIDEVFGYPAYLIGAAGAAPPIFSSTLELVFEALNPNLYIELPDFNIQSFNGSIGDIGKCIGMIPKEELSSNSADIGALSYSSAYPRPIDLGLTTDQTFYQIRARIRNAQGQIETDLDKQSSLILYFTQPAPSQESLLLNRMMEMKKTIDDIKIQAGSKPNFDKI